jgi:dTMP kinase
MKNYYDKGKRLLATFEGIDAAGKTELSKSIVEKLNEEKINVLHLEEFCPDFVDNYLGKLLDNNKFIKLNDSIETPLSETFLLLSEIAYKIEGKILQNDNCIIIADRYFDSLIAYQLPRIQKVYGINEEDFINQLMYIGNKFLIKPDITFLLKVDYEEIKKRLKNRGEEPSEEDMNFFEKVNNIYSTIYHNNNDRVIIIDNNKELDIVINKVLKKVLCLWEKK